VTTSTWSGQPSTSTIGHLLWPLTNALVDLACPLLELVPRNPTRLSPVPRRTWQTATRLSPWIVSVPYTPSIIPPFQLLIIHMGSVSGLNAIQRHLLIIYTFLVEFTPQAFLAPDLDLFFRNFSPSLVGVRPKPVLIDGGKPVVSSI
jgi:hypothetical protein